MMRLLTACYDPFPLASLGGDGLPESRRWFKFGNRQALGKIR
jgi:hypothetical protein